MGGLKQHETCSAEYTERVHCEQQQHARLSRPETLACKVCGLNFRTADALQQHVDYLGHYVAGTLRRPALDTHSEPMEVSASIESPQEHKQESTADVLMSPCESDVLMSDAFEILSVAQPAVQSLHSTFHPQDLTGRPAKFHCAECNQIFGSEGAVATHKDRAHTSFLQVINPQLDGLQVHSQSSSWSTYPDLHDEVSQCLGANGLSVEFYEEGQLEDSIRNHDTNITGVFTCPDLSCPAKEWPSMRVAITMCLYKDKQYNALVWHQRCRKCESLGELHMDEGTYTERVAYRLGKWLGLKATVPPFSGRVVDGPHDWELCEGCKNGHCTFAKHDRDDY